MGAGVVSVGDDLKSRLFYVGANLLAMKPKALRGIRLAASPLTTIASRLAPTAGIKKRLTFR
jgi:hypothetical protein